VLSAVPEDWQGENAVSEIAATPDETFLYVANRGHDSLAIFRVDAPGGRITRIAICPTEGATPRHFAIDPEGRWLVVANQGSDAVTVFRIDRASGMLQPAGESHAIPTPTCIMFHR
jgi:6-phosphogluconolactonase